MAAQKVFDENPPQQDIFVGGVLETVEHNLFTVLSNDVSSTSSSSISKPIVHISPTSMMLDSVGFLAHVEMPKKTVEQVLCIPPPGRFSECYELDLFSLRRFSRVFSWCCAFGVHLKSMGGRGNQNLWPLLVHFDLAAYGLDVLPFSWPFDDLAVAVHDNMLKMARDDQILTSMATKTSLL